MSVARRRLAWLLGWLLLTVFVALAVPRDRWGELVSVVTTARPGWLALAVVLNLFALPLQAVMWKAFLPGGVRVAWSRMLEASGVVAAVSNSVPVFMGGHASGAHVLATRGGTGHAVAFSVVALDQFAEGLAKVTLLAVVAAWAPLPAPLRIAAWTLAGGVAALGIALVVAERVASRGAQTPTAEEPGRLRGFVLAWARGLHALRSPAALARGVTACLARKTVETLAVWAVMRALAPGLPLWSVPLAMAATNVATMVAVSPANLGVYEAAAYGAWTLAGASSGTAIGLALAQHAAFLAAMLGGGWSLSTLTALTSPAESNSRG